MALLDIIQQHCLLHGLAKPPVVATATDAPTLQMLAILNDLMDMIRKESKFTGYVNISTFPALAAEDQGAMATLFPGFMTLSNGTFFNRTLNIPIIGPLTDTEWESLKAATALGPYSSYRILQGHLYMYPLPPAGNTLALEYKSKYGVQSAGGTPKQYWTLDTDIGVIDEAILRKGLAYRWKEVKGLPYQGDQVEYYNQLNNFIATDGSKRTYNLGITKPIYLNSWTPGNPWGIE